MGSGSRRGSGRLATHAALQREVVYMIYLAFSEPHVASVLQNYLRPHHSFFLLWQSRKRTSTGHNMTHCISIKCPMVSFQPDKDSQWHLPPRPFLLVQLDSSFWELTKITLQRKLWSWSKLTSICLFLTPVNNHLLKRGKKKTKLFSPWKKM